MQSSRFWTLDLHCFYLSLFSDDPDQPLISSGPLLCVDGMSAYIYSRQLLHSSQKRGKEVEVTSKELGVPF